MSVALIESADEWYRRQDLQDYLMASPLGRFWINYWRKRRGAPPIRAKEARAELAELRRRLEARYAATR